MVAADVADVAYAADSAEAVQAASDSPVDVAPLLAQPPVRRLALLPRFEVALERVS